MRERKVIVGPGQLGRMNALDEILNGDHMLGEYISAVDVQGIIYGSLMQCGAERFELIGTEEDKGLPESDFLQSRFSALSESQSGEAYKVVHDSFDPFLPEDPKDEIRSEIYTLMAFVSNLIIAAERKGSLMILNDFPDVESLRGSLPPEIIIPAKNLLATIQPIEPSLPLPKAATDSGHVRKFKQLLLSDIFSGYSRSHMNLEDQDVEPNVAAERVIGSGQSMVSQHPNLLRLKRTAVSLLPITAKTIDVVFGKLPGILAEYAADLLSSVASDRRIVVYQLGTLYYDLMKNQIGKASEILTESEDQ
jgi:hypothetical protein